MYFEHLELLPPTYIAVAEFDPLHDEGVEFARRLKDNHVFVELEEFKGMIHIFTQLEKIIPTQVTKLIESMGKFVKKFSTCS